MTIPVFRGASLDRAADHRIYTPPGILEAPPLPDWIDMFSVETARRYQPLKNGSTITATFCNVFAADVSGGLLPRVNWQTPDDEARGEIIYPDPAHGIRGTVREMNANALAQWARNHGARHGWDVYGLDIEHYANTSPTPAPTPIALDYLIGHAHALAGNGSLVLFLAPNRDPRRSGHVVVVLPPLSLAERARREIRGGSLHCAQAGRVNFRDGWWGLDSISRHGPPVVLSRPWPVTTEGLVFA